MNLRVTSSLAESGFSPCSFLFTPPAYLWIMCIATFLPTDDGFILTSNRDEHIERPTLAPTFYGELMYPKDAVAGGSWIATSPSGKVAVLLNGAFERHERKEQYRRSRGQILLDSFGYASFDQFTKEIELEDIEPFTLLLIDIERDAYFTDFRWDGSSSHKFEVDASRAHLWSSPMLYLPEQRETYQNTFERWLDHHDQQDREAILKLHRTPQDEDEGLLLKELQEFPLKTVSISQITKSEPNAWFNYLDLSGEEANLVAYKLS